MKNKALASLLIFSQQIFCDYRVIMVRHGEKELLFKEYFKKVYPDDDFELAKKLANASYKETKKEKKQQSAKNLDLLKKYKNIDFMLPLSQKGWERANALAARLSGRPPLNYVNNIAKLNEYTQYSKVKPGPRKSIRPNLLSYDFKNWPKGEEIDAIFAKGPENNNGYVRTIQTVEPLASALDLTINTKFHSNEHSKTAYVDLVNAIRTEATKGKQNILITWEHPDLPYIAKALSKNSLGTNMLPDTVFQILKKWSYKVYDQIWIFKFDSKHNLISIENMPQKLLFGDSSLAMDGKSALATYSPVKPAKT